MLKSKKDEAIKRYLSKVGLKQHKSKNYSSRYYDISYGEKREFIIRFSDHFSDNKPGIEIDLVKTSLGYYVIKLVKVGTSFSVDENNVLAYLKSILLVYPEFREAMLSFKESADNAAKNYSIAANRAISAENRLKKRTEYMDMVDEIYEQNKRLIQEISNTKAALTRSDDKLNSALKKAESYKSKFMAKNTECEQLKAKMAKIKALL